MGEFRLHTTEDDIYEEGEEEQKEMLHSRHSHPRMHNLGFVRVLTNYPVFSTLVVFLGCCCMTALLAISLVKGNENPITPEQNMYDLNDIRSEMYDGVRLAIDATRKSRNELNMSKQANRRSSRDSRESEQMFWVFESKEANIFTKEGLVEIQNAEQSVTTAENWDSHCETITRGAESNCLPLLSPTSIFFPTGWDAVLSSSIVSRIRNNTIRTLYNEHTRCIDFTLSCMPPRILCHIEREDATCKNKTDALSFDEQQLIANLHWDIYSITANWTGTGNLVDSIEQTLEFCAELLRLQTERHFVDYFMDKTFSHTNLQNKYTRSIVGLTGSSANEITEWVVAHPYEKMKRIVDRGSGKHVHAFYLLKSMLYDVLMELILDDVLIMLISIGAIFLYLWFRLRSFFLAFMGILEILLSIPCAWFIMREIFGIKMFGMLNCLVVFIASAIGVDDIFVFMHAYRSSAMEGHVVNRNTRSRFSWVWRKTAWGMGVTSATTCFAFLTTCTSPLYSTCSFGIFAALVVFCDYVLVIFLFCGSVVIYHDRFERPGSKSLFCSDCDFDVQETSPTETAYKINKDPSQRRNYISNVISNAVIGYNSGKAITTVTVVWLSVAVYFSTKLMPTTQSMQYLKHSHPLQKTLDISLNEFQQTTYVSGLPVYFVWGLEKPKRMGVSPLTDPYYIGDAVFDSDFKYTDKCRDTLLRVCDNLKWNMSSTRTKLLQLNNLGSVDVGCVLYNLPNTPTESATMKDYINKMDDHMFGWDGENVRYVGIRVNSAVLNTYVSLSEETTREQYKKFASLAHYLEHVVGNSCGGNQTQRIFVTDLDQKFIFMNNQYIYRSSLLRGIGIGIAVSFVVILFSSMSLVLATLSSICIMWITVSIVAIVVMIGWKLGSVETILITILSGFSVDYIVHLTAAYGSVTGTKTDKVRSTLGDMGVATFDGMFTSVIASLPMFMCEISFFSKFAVFMCVTVGMSWIFANFVFMSLVSTFGSRIRFKINIK